MRRVVFNQKGGVGKSSIATNLAAISADRGLRTLIIDLDPQCNTTQYLLGRNADIVNNDIGAFFAQMLSFRVLQRRKLKDFVLSTPFKNLDLIAANPGLGDMMAQLESKHKIYKLRDGIASLQDYDAIYIDTPPAFNFYSMSALIAADACLVPFDCDEFSRRALYTLMENVEETRSDHNEDLEVEGIVVNQYQPRASLPQRIIQELRDENLPVIEAFISSSIKMRESHDLSLPLIYSFPKHKLTQEFIALFDLLHPGFGIPASEESLKETASQ